MKMDDPKYARILERREARARRSKKLGRFLLTVCGICLMVTLRINPALATNVATYFAENQYSQAGVLPAAHPVSHMPINRVKIRKGIGFETQPTSQNSQVVAQDLGQQLGMIKVGE